MSDNLPAVRMSQYVVEQAAKEAVRIREHVRITSPTLTTACRQRGLPLELAELCGGLLASIADDLVAVSNLPASDFERSKRMERILAATQEPQLHALRIAMAASPVNGRACVRHWDAICEREERGMLAWLVGLDTDNAYRYGKKVEKRAK